MARTAEATPAPPPLPWHKRYRLLLQLGGLAAFGGIVAAIAVIVFSSGDDSQERLAAQRLRADLTPLMDSISVAPADLPGDWDSVSGGLGVQGGLRQADLGPATAAARSIVGNAAGWTGPGSVSLLSSGVIVADSPGLALAAFERLSAATPDEILSIVEPGADELVSVTPVAFDGDPSDRFALVVTYARGIANADVVAQGGDPEPLLISVTLHMAVTDRSLVYVAFNAFAASPPLPLPVDLAAWLDLLLFTNQAAEQVIAEQAITEQAPADGPAE